MASNGTDSEEFKKEFHDAVANYWCSRDDVATTANFGAPGGDGQTKHETAKAAHEVNAAAVRRLFDEADTRGDVDEVWLAQVATISPLELRTIRRELD